MTYKEMIHAAILSLKDRTGSSAQAIKAYIVANYPKIKFQQHALRIALKKGVGAGDLVQVKQSFNSALLPKSLKLPTSPRQRRWLRR